MTLSTKTALSRARACIRTEMDALKATAVALDEEFAVCARMVGDTAANGGKLIFSGVGKSAHIAQKLAGTFNSTGIVSCFLDPTQALHGDFGICAEGDMAFLISNSGQSEEILRIIPALKRFGLKILALTSFADSDIARHADCRLLYRVPREACPLELAPTASTTAAMALGDALAMVLLETRGFTREDFALRHPAGNLGRLLLLKVKDIMRTGDRLPLITADGTLQESILAMTAAKSGCIAIIDPKTKKLAGILTDGDFRRAALTGNNFLSKPVSKFMTRTPKVIDENALSVEAMRLFEKHKIDDLIVVDKKARPVGVIDGQDLPKLKIV
ncbi:KpsF/GutQ family sugar-phosphate isomerase [Ereboglobus luteus]|uniref:KpsF/GutQ family sugar-phosphate isomerase n=1 Tax=Ereboglobus luteus TaxID=1796921 RepID=A0A2U8E2F3_9BACT|nr:KpsF/GutQ family sugar-phosphate isomerase [Ereboglobus luteus]AWI08956.1 KpsF/GutQ family sugar-phosphate isomerase [Ereboglobus luteus]